MWLTEDEEGTAAEEVGTVVVTEGGTAPGWWELEGLSIPVIALRVFGVMVAGFWF